MASNKVIIYCGIFGDFFLFCLQEALALVVDIGVGMSQAAPGFDSPLQITSDILQMIVQRKVCH